MTLPNEEKWTLEHTKIFLTEIVNIKWPIKIRELRKKALHCLRHFPTQHRIDQLFKKNNHE